MQDFLLKFKQWFSLKIKLWNKESKTIFKKFTHNSFMALPLTSKEKIWIIDWSKSKKDRGMDKKPNPDLSA